MGINKSYLKELAEKKKYQSGGKVNVSPKTVEGYRKQYQDEVASLKDWYEKNRSRINTSVPSAYLRNQAYGPGNQSNDPYQPGEDFYPAYPFSFPELNFNIDGQPTSWNYQTGIPKSFMHRLPGADNVPIPFIPPKDNVLTISNDPQNIKDYVSEAKISGIKPNPITGAYSIDTPLILSHELGHYLNYNNPEVYQFNKQKLAETGITDTKAFQNYYGLGNRLGDSEETGAMRIVEGLSKDRKYDEFLSDAYALKQAMKREGLYDYTKGEKLTPEIWNKFKDKYGDQLVYKRLADVFQDTPKDEPDTKNVMFYLPDKNSEIYLKNKEFWDSKEKYINDVYVPNLKKERLYTNYYPDKPADVYEFMQGDQAPPPNIDSGTTYIPGVDIATEEGPVQYEGSDLQKTKIPTELWLPESGSKRGSWMKENFYNKYENTEEGRNKAYQDFLKTRRSNQPLKSPDERTIDFLNEIVKNDSEPVSIAKRGGLIQKYKSGGFSTEDKQFSVKKSTIPGANKGLFSKTSIKQGKLIGLAHENNQPVGTLGNMHNHSETPNMQSVKIGNQRYVYATRDIQPGEELTTNYRLQPELEQPEDFMGNKRFGQKGFYKPDFRTKSQIAADYGNTGESTKVAPKINPVDMRKAQEAAMQRAIANQPTFRQGRTLSANEQAENQARLAKIREQQEEEENRRRLTFTGNAEARGAGTLMQPLLDVVNPAALYYQAKDAVRGIGQTAKGVYNLNPEQVGSGLLQTGVNVAGLVPVGSSVKPALKTVSKYATTKTPLKNAYKLNPNLANPFGFKNVGDEPHWWKGYTQQVTPQNIDLSAGFGEWEKAILKNLSKGNYSKEQAQALLSKTPFSKSLGRGLEGTVYEFPNYPEYAVKIGQPSRYGIVNEEIIQELAPFTKQGNIAVPLRSSGQIKVPGAAPYQATLMQNLNKVGQPLNLSSRDAQALYLKQVRALRDAGYSLDMVNPANVSFNPRKGVYDIFDLSKRPSVAQDPKYLQKAYDFLKSKEGFQSGGTNIDLKLPQFGEDKPRPFFEITGAGTGPQYDVFGYGYVPLGKNLGISADLMRWKEGDWRGGGYGISGNINIPINRGERKIRPTVKDPVMFQGGGTMGIPGVNGQVVSSGPTPLTSVKKTRGSMSMDNKGNVKTMPTKAVKKILKNIK
jgi:hypothetical protein